MEQTIILSILVAGAIFAALAATLGLAGAVHLTSRRDHGYMHIIFYAILLAVALNNLLSGRDLNSSHMFALTGEPEVLVRHPVVVWMQRLVSLLVLTIAGERIITHWVRQEKRVQAPVALLLMAFVVFWIGTVAAPALFGTHPYLSHDYVYPLVIGIAAVLVSAGERDLAFRATRNALFLLMAASLVIIPLQPALVIDLAYTQGLLPGVPRLAGLAPHAVSLGLLAQLGLLCLMAQPYRNRWLNVLARGTGLLVLFMAQSKTAWIAFALCSACILVVRHGRNFMRRVGDPLRPEFGVASILLFMAAVITATLVLMFGDVGTRLSNFFNSAQGAQLASMTGRDQIWAIAIDEWRRNPVFGYGPTLWDENFRAAIGMPNATHAHNQFMDTLSRSGTVGAIALVLYALWLLGLSIRYARVSGGLSLALYVALTLRALSEVPLLLFGYGPELITHALLLMTLAAAAGEAHASRQPARAGLTPVHPVRKPLATAGYHA